MRFQWVFAGTVVAMLGMVALLSAQQPGGQRGQGDKGGPGGGRGGMFPGGGFGQSRMSLLRIAEVRKELELADEQIAEIEKIDAALREKYFGGRGGPGGGPGAGGPRGNRGKGDNNNQGSLTPPVEWFFVQAQAQPGQGQTQGRGRGGFGQPQTPEERAAAEKRQLERAQEERAELAKVLLPQQIKRLNEIYIQQVGTGALADEEIAKELGISDAQRAKLAEIRQQNQEAFFAAMRERFQNGGGGGGGDREAAQARTDEMRKANDAKLLAVLSADQQKKFEEMKGKPFAMPEGAGRGGPGGNRGRDNRGGKNNN